MHKLRQPLLGIIGGMGPMASNLFYQIIIENTYAKSDQDHLDFILLNHASMDDRTKCIIEGKENIIKEKLLADIEFLARAGAKYLAIPCNTSHSIIKNIEFDNIEFLDMIDLTVKHIKKDAEFKENIGIMATSGTVKMNLYQDKLLKYGLNPILPSDQNQARVMSIIYDDIKRGRAGNTENFKKIMEEFRGNNCQKIILACTELSVFNRQTDLKKIEDFEYIDPMVVLAKSAIEKCNKKLNNLG